MDLKHEETKYENQHVQMHFETIFLFSTLIIEAWSDPALLE